LQDFQVFQFFLRCLTSRDCELFLQGRIDGSPAQANLTLNARVEMPPEDLERVARDALSKTTGDRIRTEILSLHCLRPARPQPTHRYKTLME